MGTPVQQKQHVAYALVSVKLIVDGKEITGAGSSELVTAARSEAARAVVTDAVGTPTEEVYGDRKGTITVTMKQSNPDNAKLEAIFAAAEASTESHTVAITCDHLAGTDSFKADKAVPTKRADAKYAKTSSDNVWVFETGDLIIKAA
jgi:hypothetical protein